MEEEKLIPLKEVKEFFYQTAEDWHLWDEEEKGNYPLNRIFDAMQKFLDHHGDTTKG